MSKKKRAKEIVGYSVKAMFKRAAVDGARSNLVGWSKQNRKELLERVPYHERLVGDFLTERKIVFVPQCPFYFKELNKMCFVDYYVPGGDYIIEVDGGYHNMPIQAEDDVMRDSCFEKRGKTVIRIKNSETEWDVLNQKLLPVLVYAKSSRELAERIERERAVEKLARRAEKKAKKKEDKRNGEGKWKYVQAVNSILASAQENREVLFYTAKQRIAVMITRAMKADANTPGILGKIETTILQKHLSVYVWWDDKYYPGFCVRHPASPVVKERSRVKRAFPDIDTYKEMAFWV